MYLKKIEIQGFKSFADRTTIEFKDNITAIVGPNGSGKSNISDAIRWVLGSRVLKASEETRWRMLFFRNRQEEGLGICRGYYFRQQR